MKITLAVYNMKWMKELFDKSGSLKIDDGSASAVTGPATRSRQLATVVKQINPDILCIVEGPDTLKDGTKTTIRQLDAWRSHYQLCDDYRSIHGFTSDGQQELCALYKKSRVYCEHSPEKRVTKNPFDKAFYVDTTDDRIKEYYKHYRPPFEISVRKPNGRAELMRIIVAHTKSKGIYESVDLIRYERLSKRNRRKLYAECYSIRERCDQWLKDNPNLNLAVVGDINDGFGLDYYEQRFARSAVETLLGDVWAPKRILRHVLPRPKLNKYGWYPWSSSFCDAITKNKVNVLIDHILVSQNVTVRGGRVWNPFLKESAGEVKEIRGDLIEASDHFPISVEIDLDDVNGKRERK